MKFILSKKCYPNKIVDETELPHWILLYDELLDDITVDCHPIWSNGKFCDNAVKINGLSLLYVKVKTYERCEFAVKENGDALEFVPNSLIDYNLCVCAVKRNRFALKFVPQKYQTEELCMIAIKGKYKSGMIYFREMMSKTDPEYIENGYVLRYIMNQNVRIVKYALECTPDAYIYVLDCTNEIMEYITKCKLKIEKDSKFYEGMVSLFI